MRTRMFVRLRDHRQGSLTPASKRKSTSTTNMSERMFLTSTPSGCPTTLRAVLLFVIPVLKTEHGSEMTQATRAILAADGSS